MADNMYSTEVSEKERIIWATFNSLVRKAVRNRAITLKRRRKQIADREIQSGIIDGIGTLEDLYPSDYYSIVIDQERYLVQDDDLYAELSELPEKYMQAFIWHAVEKMADIDIAAVLGVRPRTIRNWRKRAKVILERCYDRYEGEKNCEGEGKT